MIKKTLILTALASAILGCASMSKNECLNANWHMIGLEDGARGASSQMLSNHRKACAKVNVTPDLDQYLAGHREGLNRYCVYHSGLALGQRGADVNHECPASARAFYDGYDFGVKIYQAHSKMDELNQKIEATRSHIDAINQEIADKEAALVDGTGSRRARREALDSIAQLREELEVQHETLSHYEYAYHRAEHRYQSLLRQK